jgi:hypothetical protein
MRDVFTSPDSSRVGLYCTILKEAGFNVFIRNESVSGAEAVIPIFYPSLSIMDDERYEEAKAMIAEHLNAPVSQAVDWTCPQCHELVPGTFDSCWKCETIRPDSGV